MTLRVIAAPDSFKGSISAIEAARAIAIGVRAAAPEAEVIEMPLADGGEGTVEALVAATGGTFGYARVADPLGRPITARYGFLGGGRADSTAVIEMAAASGLPLLAAHERNPMLASTFGTGELIADALSSGAREIVIGIGGSATVDGGTGMARALGIAFLDESGRALSGGGEILARVRGIDVSNKSRALAGVRVTVACDVTNPLTGPEGAAAVYGPQKGATPEMAAALDEGLANLAAVIRRDLGVDIEQMPGAGAAGGLGAGLVAFLGARVRSGIDIVMEAVGLPERLRGADVVFTGEGRVDAQSACGKVVSGVAGAAARGGVPVVVLAGSVGAGAERLFPIGVAAIISIARGPATEERMMSDAGPLLTWSAEQATRTFLAGRRGAPKIQAT